MHLLFAETQCLTSLGSVNLFRSIKDNSVNILITGGAGYIGSHASVVLSKAGHNIVIFDNLCNSSRSVVSKVSEIVGSRVNFIEGDVRNTSLLAKVMNNHQIDSVMHFAGLKAVGDSVKDPIAYYANNMQGAISLVQAMQMVKIHTLIFSSSAAVYGDPMYLPYREDHPTNPVNPYGVTKLQVEMMLHDLASSNPCWRIVCLRYFNPVGAHESGLIGDNPNGVPNNLMPYLARVACGEYSHLSIFGADYSTVDGTAERDYIHVMDLAEGHLAALKFIMNNNGIHTFNLGTGQATSVLNCVKEFELASEKMIPLAYVLRRYGDLPRYFANAELAKQKLGWHAFRNISDACKSAWAFQLKQNGFPLV